MSSSTMDRLEPALQAWEVLLGKAQVTRFKEGVLADISEFSSRLVPALLSPASRDQVQGLVAIANQYDVPLYTVSTGRNWGCGSRMPVRDGVLVELKRLNRIIEVNQKFRYVVLEPGVTQEQLVGHLVQAGHDLVPNIGGAGTTVSPVGNVLDRGSGVFGCKVDECLGMEVVLGSGEIVRTGLWNYFGDSEPFIHCFPVGLGPDLRGLFIQSNFGIVTRAALRLYPRRHRSMVIIGVGPGMLPELVNAAHDLRKSALLLEGLDISDAGAEVDYYPTPDHDTLCGNQGIGGRVSWTLIGCLHGEGRVAAASREEIEAYFERKPGFVLRFFSTQERAVHEQPGWLREWSKRYLGLVDNSHLEVLLRNNSKDYDLDNNRDAVGFLVLNLVVPSEGKLVDEVVKVVDGVAQSLGIASYIRGFSELGVGALKGHFSLLFDRKDEAAVKRSHRWKEATLRELRAIGIYPQRLDVDSMGAFTQASQNDYWQALKKIKVALDPKGILSAGRYLCD